MKIIKKLLLGLLVLVLLLGAAVGGLLAYQTPPPDDEIAEHMVQLMDKKLPGFAASPAAAELRQKTLASLEPGILGKTRKHQLHAKCLSNTQSIEEVDQCSVCMEQKGWLSTLGCANGPN